jgi:hypothetical protein
MRRKIAFEYFRATVLANLKTNIHLKLQSLQFLITGNARNYKIRDMCKFRCHQSLFRYFQLFLAAKEFIPQNTDQSQKSLSNNSSPRDYL